MTSSVLNRFNAWFLKSHWPNYISKGTTLHTVSIWYLKTEEMLHHLESNSISGYTLYILKSPTPDQYRPFFFELIMNLWNF